MRKLVATAGKGLVYVLASLAILMAVLVSWDFRFYKRLVTLDPGRRSVTDMTGYDTLEYVDGNDAAEPAVALPEKRTMPASALRDAVAYADSHKPVALLVAQGGVIQLEKYWGERDHRVMTRSGALHHTVLALLVGQAIADKHIAGLDAPIGRYIKEWEGDPRGAITIRQLLQMTSGLTLPASRSGLYSANARLYFGTDLAKTVLTARLTGQPGQAYADSALDAQVLGLVLQRSLEQRYGHYLSKRLWRPIQAGSARLWLDDLQGMPRTFCCLQAHPRDWLRVGQLLADDGRVGDQQVVPAEWIAAMRTPSPLSPDVGLMLHLPGTQPLAAPDAVWLAGAGGQRVYAVPSRNLVVVRIGEDVDDWDDAAFLNPLIAAAPLAAAPHPLSTAKPAAAPAALPELPAPR